jgi:hypothetical protein
VRLPEITLRAVEGVSNAGQGIATAGKVVSEASKEAAEGMAAYSAELTKTQRMRAEAKLSSGLAGVQEGLNKPYLTVREIKDALGDEGVNALPPEVRSMYIVGRDDKENVPTWAAGQAVFAAKAKRVADEAGKEVGWRATEKRDFNFAASREIQARHFSLGAQYIRQQHDYQEASQEASLKVKVDAAREAFQFDDARKDVRDSLVFDQEKKDKLLTVINKAQDTTPIYDALRTNSVGALVEQARLLADTKEKVHLNSEERKSFTYQIEERLRSLERANKPPNPEDLQKAAAERYWDSVTAAMRDKINRGEKLTPQEALKIKSSSNFPARSTETGHDEFKALVAFVDAHTAKTGTGERRKGAFDPVFYAMLNDFAMTNPEAFKTLNVEAYDFGGKYGKLSLPDAFTKGLLDGPKFTHFSDKAQSLRLAGDPKAAKPYQLGKEDYERVKRIGVSYQIPEKPVTDLDKAKLGAISAIATDALQRATPKGGELTEEQKEKVVTDAVKSVVQKKFTTVEQVLNFVGFQQQPSKSVLPESVEDARLLRDTRVYMKDKGIPEGMEDQVLKLVAGVRPGVDAVYQQVLGRDATSEELFAAMRQAIPGNPDSTRRAAAAAAISVRNNTPSLGLELTLASKWPSIYRRPKGK